MDNSKYVDLHKIAAIFRGIQEEEYAKNNEEVAELDNAMEDAVEEDNAFNTAAAKAALAGEKEFSFNGKKYPVKMSKEDAKKLMDDAVNSEEPVVEEPAVEDKDAEEVLKKGMEDELADEIKDKIEDDEESTDEAKMDAHSADMEKHLPKIYKMRDELVAKGMDQEEAMDRAMDHFGFDPDDVGEYMDRKNETTEEPQGEQVAVMSTDTLAQILNLAGVKPVTDADINQPEGEAEQVEEYSNSPEEEYADTDFMTNKLAGGANRPKKFPNVGNQGHNDLVQRLTKAYNEQKD